MGKIQISFILACILYVDLSFQSCHDNMYTNGCTIPLNVPFPFSKTVFLPACDLHDICYKCGSMYGKTRKFCDKEFKRNLKKICKSSWRLRLRGCSLFVHVYYAGVRVGGIGRYKYTPKPGCDASWVKTCLK